MQTYHFRKQTAITVSAPRVAAMKAAILAAPGARIRVQGWCYASIGRYFYVCFEEQQVWKQTSVAALHTSEE